MNMLDMHTREKANKIHLDEMHRDAQNRRLLREADRETDPKKAADQRQYLVPGIKALITLIANFRPHRIRHGSPSHP